MTDDEPGKATSSVTALSQTKIDERFACFETLQRKRLRSEISLTRTIETATTRLFSPVVSYFDEFPGYLLVDDPSDEREDVAVTQQTLHFDDELNQSDEDTRLTGMDLFVDFSGESLQDPRGTMDSGPLWSFIVILRSKRRERWI